MNAMHEDLEQFERNEVRNLVPRLEYESVIGTKWIFKKNFNEKSKIV